VRDAFEAFFVRVDTFALGVCNGCQMMASMAPVIPGAEHFPRLLRNRSEQFEARLGLVQIAESKSIFLQGMAGSRIPIVVSHGEGRVAFDTPASRMAIDVAARYVDGRGEQAAQYPLNPNGSVDAIAGFTSGDGRVTLLLPHPERTLRTANLSWAPRDWPADSPWLRMFRNARAWVG
jgi:phosphoribosylformylglycinamidine synthase